MNILNIRNRQDLISCADLYLPHENSYSICRKTFIKNLSIGWLNNRFFKQARLSDNLVGFLYADIMTPSHVPFPVLQQLYFCSIGGISGARSVISLHKELVKYAEDIGIKLVFSSSSYMDEENKFSKFLERHGWERKGSLAFFKTKHY